MSEPKYHSLEEYCTDIARQAVEECTLCGECVRNCPVVPLTPIRDKIPEEIYEKIAQRYIHFHGQSQNVAEHYTDDLKND